MADTDKELRILLKLLADTSDQSKITASLTQIQAQAKLVSAELAATGDATAPLNAGLDVSTKQMGALTKAVTSGHVSVRTLSSLFGGLGPGAVAASFGVYILINALMKQYQEHKQLTDELQAQIDSLDKQKVKWGELVAVAGEYKDVVKIDADIQQHLEKTASTLDDINAQLLKRIEFERQLEKLGVDTKSGDPYQNLPNDPDLDLAKKAVLDELTLRQQLHAEALKNLADWQNIQTEPYQQQLAEVAKRLDDLRAKREALEKTVALGTAPGASATAVSEAAKAFDQITRIDAEYLVWQSRQEKIESGMDSLDEKTRKLAASVAAADLKNLDPEDRLSGYNDHIAVLQQNLREIGVEAATPAQAIEQSWSFSKEWRDEILKLVELWRTLLGLVASTEKEQEATAKKAATDALNASLRQQQALLESIRQQQQLINEHPFLSADAKQALTLASMIAEMAQLNAAIAQDKQQLAGSALDPALHERLQAQLQKDTFEFNLLGLKIAAINQPLKAQLAEWVNSFGTSAHQIAQVIEGSINAALQGTNQLLLDSIFKTGDWRQTLMGVERQILNLFLTWIEQMALQKGAQLLGITTTTTAQAASGGAIAAAHAPAAAATSISSYGAAAVIGEVLAVAAIAAIIAALMGAFKKGGYTGDGHPDEIGGVVHKGEYVMPAHATRSLGIENLAALHRGDAHIQHFGDGGRVRVMEYGPSVGEYGHSTNYGYFGHLQPGDVAISPDMLGQYPMGSTIMIDGQPYRVADTSWFSPGNPTSNTVEIYNGDPNTPDYGTLSTTDAAPSFRLGSDLQVQDAPTPTTPDVPVWHLGKFDVEYGVDGAAPSVYPPPDQSVNEQTLDDQILAQQGAGLISDQQAIDRINSFHSGDTTTPGGIPLPDVHGLGNFLVPTPYSNFGGVTSGQRDTAGNMAFDSHAANLGLMASQSALQPTNDTSRDREGHASFSSGAGIQGQLIDGTVMHVASDSILSHPTSGAGLLANDYRSWLPTLRGYHADGARMPGAPSMFDTIPAMLAAGEVVLNSGAVSRLDASLGKGWEDALNNHLVNVPSLHFADGGRAGGGTSRGSLGKGGSSKIFQAFFLDQEAASKWLLEQPAGQKQLIDFLNANSHQFST